MTNELELCPACDVGHLRPVAKAGRRMPLKQIPDLEIPADVAMPTCDRCGAEILGDPELAALGAAMNAAYGQALSAKSEDAIRELAGAIPQREMERLIGVSAGYVSKLKHAQAEPRGPLTALLMLLADDTRLIDRLRDLWSMRARPARRRSSEKSNEIDLGASFAITPVPAPRGAGQFELIYGGLSQGRFPPEPAAPGPGPDAAPKDPMALLG